MPQSPDIPAGVPALLSTLGAFVLILVLARLKVPLSLAVLAGTVAVAALFRIGPAQTAWAMLTGAVRPITLALVVITALLLALSEMMRAGGQLEEIVSLARAWLRRPAVAMAALPALIGLLPMPGGALFSAPMVASAVGQAEVSGGRLSAINYWFRHIWEHWWPLYPGVILAVTLTGSTLGQFVAFQLPLGAFMAVGGLVIFRGAHPALRAGSSPAPAGTARNVLRATSSIWIIMVVWGVCSAALRALPEAPGSQTLRGDVERFVPITLGLLASLFWTGRLHRLRRRDVGRIFARKSIYALVGLVVAVMVFQHVLKEVGAAERIAKELTSMHLPIVLVVVCLPFIAGMVTGLAIGFVGTSFPIVLGLIAALPGEVPMRPYAVLAYACGHLGMMLSPLHLCHIVSNRYFETAFGPVYRLILPAAALTAAMASGYFLILRAVMGG